MSSENSRVLTLFKKVIEDIPYGVLIIDINKYLIYCNKAAIKVFDCKTREQIKGQLSNYNFYKLDKTTQYDPESSFISKSLGGTTILEKRMFARNVKNGSEMFFKISCYPIYNTIDVVESCVIVFEDITKSEMYIESILSRISSLEKYLEDTLKIDNHLN